MSLRARVLVVEDDLRARESLQALLSDEGYQVETAADGIEASRILAESRFDAVLLDVRMPGKDGLTVLREVQQFPNPPAILVMTAFSSSSVAIEAMKQGAYDYLTKPLRFDELLIQLERAIAGRRQLLELEVARDSQADTAETEIIGESAPMREVYKLIGQVAPTDSTVLIRGESGTGKELVARAIHAHSRRRGGPLVVVNSAAIPDSLLESELFGHEKGAFTGAVGRRRGKFEQADGGTIFLDEIGELSTATQAKLLRVLQERSIERLGSEATLRVDVRIIAATNRDLEEAMRRGAFREDLYYRLNVVSIPLPALRERREDIPLLAGHLLRKLAACHAIAAGGITEGALRELACREWPGNVRELEHLLERALVLARGVPVSVEHLGMKPARGGEDLFDTLPLEDGMHDLVARLERRLVERALTQAGGNRTRAAEILRINRRLLYDKMREFGID